MKQVIIMMLWGVGVLSGCGTSSSGDVSMETLRLFDPGKSDQPIWATWAPSKAALPTSPDLVNAVRAFDYWRVSDEGFISLVWQGMYPILDMMRLQKGADAQALATITALMTLLDASKDRTRLMDMTFVVDLSRKWEGVLCRLYGQHTNGAQYGLSILFKRGVRQVQPDEIVLWGVSGFDRGAPFSASMTRRKGQLSISRGLTLSPKVAQETSASVMLMHNILLKMIWPRVTGDAFVEPKIKRDKQRAARVASFPVAAGLKVSPRQVEDVLINTAFVPDLDIDKLDFGRKKPVNPPSK